MTVPGWRVSGGFASVRSDAHGIRIRSTSAGTAELRHGVRLEASAVDGLEVDVQGLRRGRVWLQWEGADGACQDPCRVEATRAQRGGGSATYALSVGSHPSWRGTVASSHTR